MEQVADHDRLEHVQLEVTLRSGKSGGSVVSENLGAHHRERLALGRVDLAWHDRGTGLILRKLQFTKTTSRARSKEADVLCDLEQRCGQGVELAVSLHNGVVCRKRLELVGRSDEVMAGHLANFSSNVFSKTLESVDSGSNCSSTLSKHLEARQRRLDALNAKVELLDVAREFLAKSQGCSILQVCPANLDDLLEQVALLLEGVAKARKRWQQGFLEVDDSGDVHDGREGIVGGSRHVDVVVGVDGLLGTHLAAEDLDCAVRDDFVRVHVRLGAGASLPDDKREVVDELEVSDLSGGLLDSLSDLRVWR